jgi:hypothetical protein
MFMSYSPYAEAAGRLFQYSSLSEPLARNRCIAPAINEAMEITRNFGQSFRPRRRGRLHKEDLLADHGVEKLNGNVAVWIPIHGTGAALSAQLTRVRRGQRRVDQAVEHRELVVHARLVPKSHANGMIAAARPVLSRAPAVKELNMPIRLRAP